jgi:hypothetical protein
VADDDFDFDRESELLRENYESGDKSALLKTIYAAFVLREPVPEWAARAFVDACDFVRMGGARSWDEVFGDPHLGRKISSVALENRKYEIHRRVSELHENGEPIDEGLFERVGREMGKDHLDGKPISKSVISRLYYRADGILRRLQAETSRK